MFFRKKVQTPLDEAIAVTSLDLSRHAVGTDGYTKTLEALVQLHALKVTTTKTSAFSKDTLAIVGGNLLGILMIIKHENVNVITSKALSLLLRPKL